MSVTFCDNGVIHECLLFSGVVELTGLLMMLSENGKFVNSTKQSNTTPNKRDSSYFTPIKILKVDFLK